MTDIQIALTAIKMYAETHPRPPQVTQKQAAEMMDMSEATICRMVKEGRLKLNKFGRIPIVEIDRAIAA
jgi:hypothetical protein